MIQINNNAKVVYSDQESSNGIFYEIDTVLFPPSYQLEQLDKANVSVCILLKCSLQSSDMYIINFTHMNSFQKQGIDCTILSSIHSLKTVFKVDFI